MEKRAKVGSASLWINTLYLLFSLSISDSRSRHHHRRRRSRRDSRVVVGPPAAARPHFADRASGPKNGFQTASPISLRSLYFSLSHPPDCLTSMPAVCIFFFSYFFSSSFSFFAFFLPVLWRRGWWVFGFLSTRRQQTPSPFRVKTAVIRPFTRGRTANTKHDFFPFFNIK